MRACAILARSLPSLLALSLVACSLGAPAAGPKASPAVRPKAKAGASPAAKGQAAKLRKPAQGTTTLTGLVRIEASHALATGGVLVGDAEAGPDGLAAGGLIGKVKLISDKGAGLISDKGAGLIGKVKAPLVGDPGSGAVGGGVGAAIAVGGVTVADGRIVGAGDRVIAEADGNVIASRAGGVAGALADGTLLAGGGLIGDAGSGLIGDAGSGIVANNGGGLIGDAGSGYRVAQAGAEGEAAGLGVALPAGGMLVGVVSLATRAYLPLGEDPDGKPVYAVYSDANGRFEVHLPAAERDNVLVVASVPGSRDPRGTYDFVAADRSGAFAVDDLGRMMARYIRRTFTGRLAATLQAPALSRLLIDNEATFGGAAGQPGTARGDVHALIDLLEAIGAETGIGPDTPAEVRERVAQRLVDLGLARTDLAKTFVDVKDNPIWTTSGGAPRAPYPVLDAYRAGLIVLLDGATKKLRAEPGFFTQPFLADVVNAPDGGEAPPLKQDWTGRVRTPADVGEFLMVEYFAAVRGNGTAPTRRMYQIFHEARGDADPEATAFETLKVLSSTVTATSVAIARTLTRPELRAEVRAIMAAPEPAK